MAKKNSIIKIGPHRVDRSTGEVLRTPAASEMQAADNNDIGISCPRCGCRHLDTYDSRPVRGGLIRRYKQCRACGRTGIRTIEEIK